jgi:hypothetical protein
MPPPALVGRYHQDNSFVSSVLNKTSYHFFSSFFFLSTPVSPSSRFVFASFQVEWRFVNCRLAHAWFGMIGFYKANIMFVQARTTRLRRSKRSWLTSARATGKRTYPKPRMEGAGHNIRPKKKKE